MKNPLFALLLTTALSCATANAQMGPMPGGGGPDFNNGMARLFGENQAFSAELSMETEIGPGQKMLIPGQFAYDKGKTRYAMNMGKASGGPLGDQAMAQMELLGLATMIIVTVPETNTRTVIVPGLRAYAPAMGGGETGAPATPPAPASDFTVQTTELARETVDGHPTIKNKNVITLKGGAAQEVVTWNATDLKNFPIKLEVGAGAGTPPVVMLFKDIKLGAPPAADFAPPQDFTRYDTLQGMIMAKVMGGARGGLMMPPGGMGGASGSTGGNPGISLPRGQARPPASRPSGTGGP